MTPIERYNWNNEKFYPLGIDKEHYQIEGGIVLIARKNSKNTIQIYGIGNIIEPKTFRKGETIAENVVCIEGKVRLKNDPKGDLPVLIFSKDAIIEAKPLIGYKTLRLTYKPVNPKNY